jgi:hypothetical protein
VAIVPAQPGPANATLHAVKGSGAAGNDERGARQGHGHSIAADRGRCDQSSTDVVVGIFPGTWHLASWMSENLVGVLSFFFFERMSIICFVFSKDDSC